MKTLYEIAKESNAKYYEVEALASALGYLKNLVNTEGGSCVVEKEHKEAVRLYVESWIIPSLETLLGSMLGHKGRKEDLKYRVFKSHNDHAVEGAYDVLEDILRKR